MLSINVKLPILYRTLKIDKIVRVLKLIVRVLKFSYVSGKNWLKTIFTR